MSPPPFKKITSQGAYDLLYVIFIVHMLCLLHGASLLKWLLSYVGLLSVYIPMLLPHKDDIVAVWSLQSLSDLPLDAGHSEKQKEQWLPVAEHLWSGKLFIHRYEVWEIRSTTVYLHLRGTYNVLGS